jgi:hypothetical protein
MQMPSTAAALITPERNPAKPLFQGGQVGMEIYTERLVWNLRS